MNIRTSPQFSMRAVMQVSSVQQKAKTLPCAGIIACILSALKDPMKKLLAVVWIAALLLSSMALFAETGDAPDENERIFLEINRVRAERGLRPLVMYPEINAIAATHSDEMAIGQRKFSHTKWEERFD